jgi:segregation and condensation protein B
MDDREALSGVTDCAADDSPMSNAPPVRFTESPLPDEFEPLDPDSETASPVIADDEDQPFAPAAVPADLRAQQIIEALLFSSDAPLSAARLADLVRSMTPTAVRLHIATLNDKYRQAGLSFRIETIARGFQMMTLPDFAPWVAELNKHRSETRLSAAALETLSIIAYKQPIIRADVEAIRGVACGEVIARLRDMGLVRVLGRAEIVGRPLLYGTTRKFLDVFGLADLDDLPPMEALTLRPVSKPIEEVEPVKPPAIPEPPVLEYALAEDVA